MTEITDSLPFRIRDPARIAERRQTQRQRRRAQAIARLPENLWPEKLKLEPRDDREEIWRFLCAIRTARSNRYYIETIIAYSRRLKK